jgi:hypothetical protein
MMDKLKQAWYNVKSIVLSSGLFLLQGAINDASPSIAMSTATTTVIIPAAIAPYDVSCIKFVMASGSVSGGILIASVGTVGAAYDNVLTPITFTSFSSIGDVWRAYPTNKVARVGIGEALIINITSAYTGSSPLMNAFVYGEYA